MIISHIVNPVYIADSSRDLYHAQPITFETMKRAAEFSNDECTVELFTVQYEEDRRIIPEYFLKTEDLTRSVLDIKSFKKQRKLPLIKDILDRLYENATGDFLIYSNVDIALQTYFYKFIKRVIEKEEHDAFIINRRTISEKYKDVKDIPLMYGDVGKDHKGWDCFVFKKELYPKFDLGLGVIGQGWIGRILLSNLLLYSKKFKIFEKSHLTFHIGNDKSWKTEEYRDYQDHNMGECKKILDEYEKKNGQLDRSTIPGNFLSFEARIVSNRQKTTIK